MRGQIAHARQRCDGDGVVRLSQLLGWRSQAHPPRASVHDLSSTHPYMNTTRLNRAWVACCLVKLKKCERGGGKRAGWVPQSALWGSDCHCKGL
jgi:hypothetical protein